MKGLVFAALVVGLVSDLFGSQVVMLSKNNPPIEIGQGFLAHVRGQCHLIMPSHVASEGAVNFRQEGSQPVYGTAGEEADLGDDISIFPVGGVSTALCGSSLSVLPRAVDAALQKSQSTQLRFINGDGSIGRMAVAVIDNDQATFLRVKPLLADERISKGLSGSLLIADGSPIGMLLSVHARTGVGTVMRQDTLLRKAEQYLRQVSTFTASTPDGGDDTLDESLKLIAWNALPAAQDTGGADPSEAMIPSRYVYAGSPLVLDFEVLTANREWSGVRIDGRGVRSEERPATIEILMSPSKDAVSWTPVKTQQLNYVDDAAMVIVAPRRAALLRLRFWPAKHQDALEGDNRHLGVGRVNALR